MSSFESESTFWETDNEQSILQENLILLYNSIYIYKKYIKNYNFFYILIKKYNLFIMQK
jgi:hypothetical protein